MTVSATTSRNDYIGDGSAGGSGAPYTVSFRFFADADLLVTKRDAAGSETTLALGIDYAVTGAGSTNGGTMTLTAGNLAAGYTLTVRRVLDLLQQTDLRNQGSFLAETHERVFDRLVMIAQQQQDTLERSLVAAETDGPIASLPARALRALKALWFDAAGDPALVGSVTSLPDVSVSLVVDTVAQLKALAAPSSALTYLVRGYYAAGDGGGGVFRWNSADATTDNGGTVVQLNAGGVGRWNRVHDGVLSAKWFGAKGDGATDDTTALQGWLNACSGGCGILPAGTFISLGLTIKTNTRIVGAGPGISEIRGKATLAAGSTLLLNQNYAGGGLNGYTDTNITIEGISFKGLATTRTGSLMALDKILGVRLENCKIYNCGYIGLEIGGSKNVVIQGCEFTGCGNPTVTTEGGPAIWIGPGSDTTKAYDVLIEHCFIHDNEWAAIYLNGWRNTVQNCDLITNKEAGVFCTGSYNKVVDCTIVGVSRKYISASGIESGGVNNVFNDNIIASVEASCVALTDTQNITVNGNDLISPAQDNITYPTGSGVTIITTQTNPNQPRNISIIGNTIQDGTAKAYAAVDIGNSGDPPLYILIADNNCLGTTWASGNPMHVQAGKMSTSILYFNNAGQDDVVQWGGYAAARYYTGECSSVSGAATIAMVANTLYVNPFAVRKTVAWTKIGIEVTAFAAGKSARLGIYNFTNGVPTTLVLDAGTVSVAANGVQEVTINQILPPGMYAVCIVSDGTPTVRALATTFSMLGTVGIGTGGTADAQMNRAFTYGVLPATFGAVTYLTSNNPGITMRTGV
jgi:hypothetical protein